MRRNVILRKTWRTEWVTDNFGNHSFSCVKEKNKSRFEPMIIPVYEYVSKGRDKRWWDERRRLRAINEGGLDNGSQPKEEGIGAVQHLG